MLWWIVVLIIAPHAPALRDGGTPGRAGGRMSRIKEIQAGTYTKRHMTHNGQSLSIVGYLTGKKTERLTIITVSFSRAVTKATRKNRTQVEPDGQHHSSIVD